MWGLTNWRPGRSFWSSRNELPNECEEIGFKHSRFGRGRCFWCLRALDQRAHAICWVKLQGFWRERERYPFSTICWTLLLCQQPSGVQVRGNSKHNQHAEFKAQTLRTLGQSTTTTRTSTSWVGERPPLRTRSIYQDSCVVSARAAEPSSSLQWYTRSSIN